MKTPERLRHWLQVEFLRQQLRTSLTFFPALAVVLAVGSAKALVAADMHLIDARARWYLFAGGPESARELLSTIASSLMTFTGLVFSITILVLQLANTQFSSRVLRTFLEDGFTRFAMSVFVGSFVFAMVLLPEVRSAPEDATFVPRLAVFAAFALVVFSVGVFIRYIHHMAHSIRAVHVLHRVAAETRAGLEAMYPEEIGEPVEEALPPPEGEGERIPHGEPAGVVTSVDEAALMRWASEQEVVVELLPELGDFVPQGAPLFRIWRKLPEQDLEPLRSAIVIAKERTPHQDPAFGFRQLVDVAERALSPGINDPTTAVQALDCIHDLLRALSRRRFPPATRADEAGRLRLILHRPEWGAYVRLALDEIRQYGGGSIQVMRRLRALLRDLLTVTPGERREPLEAQLRLLDAAVDRGFHTEEERTQAKVPSITGQGGP